MKLEKRPYPIFFHLHKKIFHFFLLFLYHKKIILFPKTLAMQRNTRVELILVKNFMTFIKKSFQKILIIRYIIF